MNRLGILKERLVEHFGNWIAAKQDVRCHDVADWVVWSVMNPEQPGAALPDPDTGGNEVVDALCRRFGC